MNKIDWDKPLQAKNGHPVELIGQHPAFESIYRVIITLPYGFKTIYWCNIDGTLLDSFDNISFGPCSGNTKYNLINVEQEQ